MSVPSQCLSHALGTDSSVTPSASLLSPSYLSVATALHPPPSPFHPFLFLPLQSSVPFSLIFLNLCSSLHSPLSPPCSPAPSAHFLSSFSPPDNKQGSAMQCYASLAPLPAAHEECEWCTERPRTHTHTIPAQTVETHFCACTANIHAHIYIYFTRECLMIYLFSP